MTLVNSVDFDELIPGPVYDFSWDFSQMGRSEHNTTTIELKEEFKQNIKSIISENDQTRPKVKALDQYATSVFLAFWA